MKTPIIVFERRVHGTVTEHHRSRPTVPEFFLAIVSGIRECIVGNPDEIIIRILRPVDE